MNTDKHRFHVGQASSLPVLGASSPNAAAAGSRANRQAGCLPYVVALLLTFNLQPSTCNSQNLLVDTHNFVSVPTANRRITLTLLQAGAVTAGPWLIAGDSVALFTDTNGTCTFSNLLEGGYRLDIAGNPTRSFPLGFPSTNGTVNAASLIGATNTSPYFYTANQVDALIASGDVTSGQTNVTYVLAAPNTNLAFVTGAGTTALNGEYGFSSNWPGNGFCYTNFTHTAYFLLDHSGNEDNDLPFSLNLTTNTEDGSEYYQNDGNRLSTNWQVINGAAPAPVFSWGTNFITNTTSFYVRQFPTNRVLICPPGASLTAVANAAMPGDTILVEPGTYNANNLLRNGVDWFFYPGAHIYYTDFGIDYCQAEDTAGCFAIFDDSGQGACTSNIEGYGTFDFRTSHGGFPGIFYTTNSGSRLNVSCDEMSGRLWGSAFIANTPLGRGLMCVSNCALWNMKCKLASNTNQDYSAIVGYNGSSGTTNSANTGNSCNGFVWRMGETHINCDANICPGGQAVWAMGKVDGTSDVPWFYTGQYLQGTLYSDSVTTNSISWYNVVLIDASHSGFGAVNFYSGKNYLTAQKILGSTSPNLAIEITDASYNWINVQKISSAGTWINFDGNTAGIATGFGSTWADILYLEELAPGISVGVQDTSSNNCALYLRGNSATLSGVFAMSGASGGTFKTGNATRSFSDLTINSLGTTNIFGVETNNLVVKNCVLNALGGWPPFYTLTSHPQTVTCFNTIQSSNNGPNITVVGGFTTNINLGSSIGTIYVTNGVLSRGTIP